MNSLNDLHIYSNKIFIINIQMYVKNKIIFYFVSISAKTHLETSNVHLNMMLLQMMHVQGKLFSLGINALT